MKIVFDLDGVIRDMDKKIFQLYGFHIIHWFWEYKKLDVYGLAKKNYSIVRDAPPTKYYSIIKKYYPCPEIWTYQLSDWQKYTLVWLSRHFIKYKIRFLTPYQKYLELRRLRRIWLVDDFPGYSHYNKIILIDRPYNRCINAPMRVKTIRQLEDLIKHGSER